MVGDPSVLVCLEGAGGPRLADGGLRAAVTEHLLILTLLALPAVVGTGL